MTVSGLTGANLSFPDISSSSADISGQVVKEEKTLTTEEYVQKYFSDVPVLAEVARCESQYRQLDSKGNVLRGEANIYDRGVMQINELYHLEKAKSLGYDIMTLQGNVAYGRYLFEKEGLKPWAPSAPCWSKTQAYSEYHAKQLAMK